MGVPPSDELYSVERSWASDSCTVVSVGLLVERCAGESDEIDGMMHALGLGRSDALGPEGNSGGSCLKNFFHTPSCELYSGLQKQAASRQIYRFQHYV